MEPRPVTIRLLDPPIHEFLPSEKQLELELDHLHQLRKTVEGVADLTGALRLLHTEIHGAPPMPFGEGGTRITSYNVCYSKLLRVVGATPEELISQGYKPVGWGPAPPGPC